MARAVTRRLEVAALLVMTLAAAFLRLYRLDEVPPGWRDDELINSLVISQHVLDGEWALFYPDASGHEGLYHILNAGMMALFGPGVAGIRWLSAILGLFSVVLTFQLGRQLFGGAVGLIAALGLGFSFWSLMYSRLGLRHVSLLPLALAAYLFLWKGLQKIDGLPPGHRPLAWYRQHFLSGVLLGLSWYTYFAARGLPLVVLALAGYWFLFDRQRFRRHWRGLALVLVVAAITAAPLLLSLARLPEMTGRVGEVAIPLVEARAGNWGPLLSHLRITLSMFHADGDSEWLYNLPHRPLFSPLGALLLLGGLLISLYRGFPPARTERKGESIFMLAWMAVGLAPGFISVPPASLGHTIAAQPAAYLLPAIAIVGLAEMAVRPAKRRLLARSAAAVLAVVFLANMAVRDLTDYFLVWPQKGMVRFLYRADIREMADYLNAHPDVQDVAFASLLAGPWDRKALLLDLERPVADRWFDPRRALVYPEDGGYVVLPAIPELAEELEPLFRGEAEPVADLGTVRIYRASLPALGKNVLPGAEPVPFANGLVLTHVELLPSGLLTQWRAEGPPFGLPAFRLVSNPPPPGADTRPRLSVFAHLLDSTGELVAGDDGFWADPYTLRAGDTLLQLHRFSEPLGTYDVVLGLYDPVTGERVPLISGEDRLVIRAAGQ